MSYNDSFSDALLRLSAPGLSTLLLRGLPELPGLDKVAGMVNFWKLLPRPIRALAPMEDVTDMVFRPLVASLGRPDVQFTEFTSAELLVSARPRLAMQRLVFDPNELSIPLVAQIWGSDVEAFFKAAGQIAEMGFHGLDINMGCPVKKIARKGGCSALIAQPALAAELIQAAREGAKGLPVSVKTRVGLKKAVTESWCGFLLEQRLPVLTVHGRTAAQQSEGLADWNEIAKVVALRNAISPDTLILGNGDVKSQLELLDRVRRFGVDGVMIGRGVFQDPAIFAVDRPHRSFADFSMEEKLSILVRHIEGYRDVWGRTKDYEKLKRFYKIYTVGFEGALSLRDRLMETHDFEAALAAIGAFSRAREAFRGADLSEAI